MRVHRMLLVGPAGEHTLEEDVFRTNTSKELLEQSGDGDGIAQ